MESCALPRADWHFVSLEPLHCLRGFTNGGQPSRRRASGFTAGANSWSSGGRLSLGVGIRSREPFESGAALRPAVLLRLHQLAGSRDRAAFSEESRRYTPLSRVEEHR